MLRPLAALIGIQAILAILIFYFSTRDSQVLFAELTFEEACQMAGEKDMLVFVYFSKSDCDTCREMENTTYQNIKVIRWLKNHTVPIQSDADVHPELAEKYQVSRVPFFMFINPDGKPIERFAEDWGAENFLNYAENIRIRLHRIVNIRRTLENGSPMDPSLNLELAEAYAANRDYDDSLRQYLWCMQQGDHDAGFREERSEIIRSFSSHLLRLHPPAAEELKKLRDSLQVHLQDDDYPVEDYDRLNLFAHINEVLGEHNKNLEIFDLLTNIPEVPNPMKERLVQMFFADLVAAHRYVDIVTHMDVLSIIKQRYPRLFEPASEDNLDARPVQIRGRSYRNILPVYRVLIGAGKDHEAQELADAILQHQNDATMYNEIAWSGYLSGTPNDHNLEQARRAFELSEGKDLNIVDTLVRILFVRGHKEEAIQKTREGLKTSRSWRGTHLMEECLKDFGITNDAAVDDTP